MSRPPSQISRQAWPGLSGVLGLAACVLCTSSVARAVPPAANAPEAPVTAPTERSHTTPSEPAVSDPVSDCVDAHARGQEARLDQRWLDAQAAFTQCGNSACPELVRVDCSTWQAELDAQLPRVIFELSGTSPERVNASVDGKAFDLHPGEVYRFDPGVHEFLFEAVGHPIRKLEVRLGAGAPTRELQVDLAPSPASPARAPAPPSRSEPAPPKRQTARAVHTDQPTLEVAGIPLLTWIFGGVAVAGAGVGTYFGARSLQHESSLQRSCAPLCGRQQVDSLRQEVLAADLGFGVGLVGAAAGTVFYLLEHRAPSASVGETSSLHIGVDPRGISVALDRRF